MKSIDSERISHAYIVSGETAESLAKTIVCSSREKRPCLECPHCKKANKNLHPDIIEIKPTKKQNGKKEIHIDQIRELKRDAIIVPNEADKKAYIIYEADSMNHNAQNALLRILEEPPTHAVFILKTDTPDELLETIHSRCVRLKNIIPETTHDETIIKMAKDFLKAAKTGNLPLIKFMYQLEKLKKNEFIEFIETAREYTISSLRASATENETELRESLSHIERILVSAAEYLDYNINTGHIAGMICANLMQTDVVDLRR